MLCSRDAESHALRALAYHARSKHHLNAYARSPGGLDWATQPEPFRTFEGAPVLPLPLRADSLTTAYDDLYRPGAVPARPVDLDSIATLFELGLGLSAWKQAKGARWALRCNPSSGNLHPTEGYLLLPGAPGVPAGLYHYVSRDHALERRSTLGEPGARTLAGLLPPDGLVIGLSSIHWREAWKYGERAFRYCQHDVGHAVASIRYAAAALGWKAVLLEGFGDADLAALLGLNRDEAFKGVEPPDREHPDTALLILPRGGDAGAAAAALSSSASEAVACVRAGTWAGEANVLSPRHVDWEVIEEAARATWKEPSPQPTAPPTGELPPLSGADDRRAAEIIRTRRSAVDFDGQTAISADAFYGMLDHLLPRPDVPPWDAIPWAPHVHLGIFVHRVRGLAPGLYLLERAEAAHERLRAALSDAFDWTRPPGCPSHLRLYCLAEADLRRPAQIVSCHQEIASDSAFSLGMIADFGESIRARGAPWYRRLFWESGALGHVLYLEAEAASRPSVPVRATGIGCYFDDAFHDLCGLSGDAFQSLYHFTVGGPVEDTRIMTRPPYEHLAPERRGASG